MTDHLIITGATGWLGSSLLSLIEQETPDCRVSVLVLPGEGDSLATRHPNLDIELVEGDITDPVAADALCRHASPSTAVIHAAGIIHPPRVSDFARINAGGARVIASAAARARVGRFVHISSNSPFGLNSSPSDVFRANEPYRPYLGYGKSKMDAELVVRREADAGAFDLIILRPPWFYGPGQPARQATFLSLVRQGKFPIPGSGDQRRSMVFVPDLARAALAATQPSAKPGAYWIADPEPYALIDIVRLTQSALTAEGIAVKPGARHIPSALSSAARRADAWMQRRGRYSAQVHVLGELGTTIACEVGPAQDALGWMPGNGLVEGMRASIRDWLARGNTIA